MFKNYHWKNKPQNYSVNNKNELKIHTDSKTDLWQRTHYGFSIVNAPMFLTTLGQENVIFSVKTSFESNSLYDQCGILIYIDDDNWAKFSSEYEDESFQRLGGVVTKMGYSDWATTDISKDIQTIYYKLQRHQNDFIIKYSFDGENYFQLRIFNLGNEKLVQKLEIGLYACSPIGDGFDCSFSQLNYLEVKHEDC